MINRKSDYSPYCKLCGSCGEDGCCSYIGCFSALVENPKCDYGKTYVKDAILNHGMNKMVFQLMDKMESDAAYTKEQFITDFNTGYDKLLDDFFNGDETNKCVSWMMF